MRKNLLVCLIVLGCVLGARTGFPADTNAVITELKEVVAQVQAKMKQDKTSEADLSPELKALDGILARHKGEKTEDLAQVVLLKGMLYVQVIEDEAKGKKIIQMLKTDFPDTKAGKNADAILASIEVNEKSKKIRDALSVGAKFPDFAEKDTAGKPLSIANYKGKVVLVDFWATWCGPCVRELPTVLKTYEQHHAAGFEIIGISLDEDREALNKFVQQKKMSWAQYFDGLGWSNKLAAKYGVISIPTTYLLDGEGKIIGRDLRGENLEAAVVKALQKK